MLFSAPTRAAALVVSTVTLAACIAPPEPAQQNADMIEECASPLMQAIVSRASEAKYAPFSSDADRQSLMYTEQGNRAHLKPSFVASETYEDAGALIRGAERQALIQTYTWYASTPEEQCT